MKNRIKLLIGIMLLVMIFVNCNNPFIINNGEKLNKNVDKNEANVQWARTITTDSGYSRYISVTVDASGNIYAVGCLGRIDDLDSVNSYVFGNNITLYDSQDVVLVKYDKRGNTQWVRTTGYSLGYCQYNSIVIDSSENIYIVGYLEGTLNYGFGNITESDYHGAILVKYDKYGNIQWTRTIASSLHSEETCYTSVAIDSVGNIYTAGIIEGELVHDFGNNVTLSGSSYYYNVLLVKYDSSGNTQWARTVSSTYTSYYNYLAVDNLGYIYVTGYFYNSTNYDFGNGVTIRNSGGVLVKYDSSGNAQWVRSTVSGYVSDLEYNSVAIDSVGDIYVAGRVRSIKKTFDFGNNVSIIKSSNTNDILLVKYNSSGDAQWARTADFTNGRFYSVATDSSGNIYAAGYIYVIDMVCDFGNGVIISESNPNINNLRYGGVLLTKYNSNGDAQWAKISKTNRSSSTQYNSVAADSSGNVYAAGFIEGKSIYDFGNNVVVDISSETNYALLVKYH